MIEIRIDYKDGVYDAWIDTNPLCWGTGNTPEAAVGNMTMGEVFKEKWNVRILRFDISKTKGKSEQT